MHNYKISFIIFISLLESKNDENKITFLNNIKI